MDLCTLSNAARKHAHSEVHINTFSEYSQNPDKLTMKPLDELDTLFTQFTHSLLKIPATDLAQPENILTAEPARFSCADGKSGAVVWPRLDA